MLSNLPQDDRLEKLSILLAFHMIPMARVDPDFAKQQLLLFLREWGTRIAKRQIPADEFAFGDVNPPVHAVLPGAFTNLPAPEENETEHFWKACFKNC